MDILVLAVRACHLCLSCSFEVVVSSSPAALPFIEPSLAEKEGEHSERVLSNGKVCARGETAENGTLTEWKHRIYVLLD